MTNIYDLAIADWKTFSQQHEIIFVPKNEDDSAAVTVHGLVSKHNLSINPNTGLPVNTRNAHVSVIESVLIEAGYTTRNNSNEIDLISHSVIFSDASGRSFKFLIDETMPSETFGLIVCTLGNVGIILTADNNVLTADNNQITTDQLIWRL